MTQNLQNIQIQANVKEIEVGFCIEVRYDWIEKMRWQLLEGQKRSVVKAMCTVKLTYC